MDIKKGTAWGIIKLHQDEQWTVYKKIWCRCPGQDAYAVATLEIPPGATVVRPGIYQSWIPGEKTPSNKLRADQAKVVNIEPINRPCLCGCQCFSNYYPRFSYQVGATVVPMETFNADDEIQCGSGIHFFMTEEEARDYI